MSSTPQSVQDDLAFMRSVVQSGDGIQIYFGSAYFAGGVCYSAQMILSAGEALAWLPANPAWSLTVALAPTVIFLAILTAINWRSRLEAPTGLVWRAVTAVFGCVGVANLALIAVIGSVALRQHSVTTWLIYPCVVFVLQGVAWLAAFALRRRVWLGLVAAGWFITAIVMACLVQDTAYYILSAGVGLLLFMVLPGAVTISLARARV